LHISSFSDTNCPLLSLSGFIDCSVRKVNVWNSLSNKVVEADTVDTFKRRLDKFWADQNVILDYKAELTGLISRSKVNI